MLRAVTFSSSSEDPTGTQSASEREVAFVISDGDADSNMATRTISVMPVNDAPVLSAVEHSSLVYVENQAAPFVSDTLVVSDVDFITDVHLGTPQHLRLAQECEADPLNLGGYTQAQWDAWARSRRAR